eukprot:TRINITY_DN1686_c0_g2_i18.p1 TRINITY_DN1686_c0_g2~~TRINITY_DN1686_c0_g2_i18.p1  ORF type:complete len:166 (+),score=18.59 TRINITY_DN1686_c0_g2_i18:71-568(+)
MIRAELSDKGENQVRQRGFEALEQFLANPDGALERTLKVMTAFSVTGELVFLERVILETLLRVSTSIVKFRSSFTRGYYAAHCLANISATEKHTSYLVEAGVINVFLSTLNSTEGAHRTQLVRCLYHISESIWYRDGITQGINQIEEKTILQEIEANTSDENERC